MSYHTRNRKSSKQQLSYRAVSCPTCGAKPGDMCVVLHNLQATKFAHSARRDKYKHEIGGMNTPLVDGQTHQTCSFPTKAKSEQVWCEICGVGTASKVKRAYRTKYDGQVVSLPSVEMFRCSDCHEEFFGPEQARAASIEVKNAVRQSSGLLAPERIVAIREKLGLTQTQLEHLFDQGPKVVTRWESGRVIQNKNADTILRMLDRNPKLLALVKEIEKTRDQAQRKHAKSEPLELAATR